MQELPSSLEGRVILYLTWWLSSSHCPHSMNTHHYRTDWILAADFAHVQKQLRCCARLRAGHGTESDPAVQSGAASLREALRNFLHLKASITQLSERWGKITFLPVLSPRSITKGVDYWFAGWLLWHMLLRHVETLPDGCSVFVLMLSNALTVATLQYLLLGRN